MTHEASGKGLVAAMVALAEAGVPTDVQSLLVHGNPSWNLAPGALAKALVAAGLVVASNLKDGTARESDLAREESGKSDLMERLRAHLRRCIPFSEASALLTEAANALATVEAEIQGRDNTIDALEFLKNQAEARALTAETRLSGMVEAVKKATSSGAFFTGELTDLAEAVGKIYGLEDGPCPPNEFCAAIICRSAGCLKDKADRGRAALSVLADIEGNNLSVAKSGSTPAAKTDGQKKSEWESTGYEGELLVNGNYEAGANATLLSSVRQEMAHYAAQYAPDGKLTLNIWETQRRLVPDDPDQVQP